VPRKLLRPDYTDLTEGLFKWRAHVLSHPGRYRAGMIPLDLVFALLPAALWACLWLADRMRG